MGIIYSGTEHIPIDHKEAAKFFKLASDQGHGQALCHLAARYKQGGQGVPQNDKEAFRLFLLAAEKGDSDGQGNVGLMFKQGRGVKQDYEKAKWWYEKAVEQRNVTATMNLGNLYAEGKGAWKDLAKAQRLFRKAEKICIQTSEEPPPMLKQINEAFKERQDSIINISQPVFGGTASVSTRTVPLKVCVASAVECANCGVVTADNPGVVLKPCSRCTLVFYCGKDCQSAHWKKRLHPHKRYCCPLGKTVAPPDHFVKNGAHPFGAKCPRCIEPFAHTPTITLLCTHKYHASCALVDGMTMSTKSGNRFCHVCVTEEDDSFVMECAFGERPPKNAKEQAKDDLEQAEFGLPDAQFHMATRYMHGIGVERNGEEGT